MLVDHIHFYVQNQTETCTYLKNMGFKIVKRIFDEHIQSELLHYNNSVFLIISSSLNPKSPIYHYLNNFASGIADVAFQVKNIDYIVNKLTSLKGYIIDQPYTYFLAEGKIKIAKVKGFGSLEHTLVENYTKIPFVYLLSKLKTKIEHSLENPDIYELNQKQSSNNNNLNSIDHIVLNVAKGKLTEAVQFYCQIFGFKIWQKFKIKTDKSGLFSQVLSAPNNGFYFNINEPTSPNSQIQEFIDFNGGSGIQHIAVHTNNIIKTVTQMRSQGLDFLPMLNSYYNHLKKHGRNGIIPNLTSSEWEEIEKQKILLDFNQDNPESLLMQIFTKPIFNEPTFFFELIERRKQSQGFGEANFQVLFEIIEKEQITRNQKVFYT